METIDKKEWIHRLALISLKGIGNITARNLLQVLGSATAIFETKKQNLVKLSGIGFKTANQIRLTDELIKGAELEYKFCIENNYSIHCVTDNNYPNRLKNCFDAPILLFQKGSLDFTNQKTIAIIGTRNATDFGKKFAQQIIEELAVYNPIIVSGLALGIDTIAHKAALKNNLNTVAILAHGLDRTYPHSNTKLASEISKQGCLLTEFKQKTNPDASNFPMRNRIVAGLCDAVLVVESFEKGGALITAKYAFEYNREVFAVPGKPSDLSFAGCNKLIKQNIAQLITSSDEIIEGLSWDKKIKPILQTKLFEDLNDDEIKITKLLISEPKSVDFLNNSLDFSSSKLASVLLTLELKNVVEAMPGKMYKLS